MVTAVPGLGEALGSAAAIDEGAAEEGVWRSTQCTGEELLVRSYHWTVNEYCLQVLNVLLEYRSGNSINVLPTDTPRRYGYGGRKSLGMLGVIRTSVQHTEAFQ